jgi:hypothetical protein
MLEPQVKLRAESGRLNNLSFEFTYNDDASKGSLEMNYNDLKLMAFKDGEKVDKKNRKKRKRNGDSGEGEELTEKAGLKSFVLNTFIIRKNMDSNTAEEKRTGTIHFDRDKRRSIFNYWAKSMFSGIKSAYNLDKLEDSRIKRMMDKKQ